MDDIFKHLLIEKYRPPTLNEVVLTDENRRFFESLRDKQEIPNLLFSGNNGIGKTVMAKVTVNDILQCQYLYINASDENGIDVARTKITGFAQTKSIDGKIKVVILDEADGLTAASQGLLRNTMEEYAYNTRFILTCNYPHKIIPALHSRCQTLDLTPPFDGVVKRCIEILKAEKIKVSNETAQKLVDFIKKIYPDIRRIIGELQKRCVNGELIINEVNNKTTITNQIFDHIIGKKDIFELRKFVIQNEIDFNNDYLSLLKELFDTIYNTNMDVNKKKIAMVCISDAMYKHQFVLDYEINFFACMLQLSDIV